MGGPDTDCQFGATSPAVSGAPGGGGGAQKRTGCEHDDSRDTQGPLPGCSAGSWTQRVRNQGIAGLARVLHAPPRAPGPPEVGVMTTEPLAGRHRAVPRRAPRPSRSRKGLSKLAPRVGFEPTTLRLTAGCSAVELPRKSVCSRRATASGWLRAERPGSLTRGRRRGQAAPAAAPRARADAARMRLSMYREIIGSVSGVSRASRSDSRTRTRGA